MTVGTRQLETERGKFQIGKTVFGQHVLSRVILSSCLVFCLGQLGCEVQEESPHGLVNNSSSPNSHPVQAETSVSPQLGQSKATEVSRIIAFGDSLTAGLGVSPEQAYPEQLADLLRQEGLPFEVINAGVSGDTSAGGLRRVDWILKSCPTVVILELGANDGLRGQPLQETFANLQGIIERLQAEGVIVVLAGMRLPLNYGEEYTRQFSQLYDRLANDYDLALIPFFLEGVATHRHLNQGDGIHPTGEGYSIVVRNVWRTLRPIVKEITLKKQREPTSSC